jgi:hypothetical protein
MMQDLTLLLFLTAFAMPALGIERVTVEQVDQALAVGKNKPDQEVMRRLYGLELTERMSTQMLLADGSNARR